MMKVQKETSLSDTKDAVLANSRNHFDPRIILLLPWNIDTICFMFMLQGCLEPIRVVVPTQSILDPSEDAAVVGGNVQTSQRIVDVIFRAFRLNYLSFRSRRFGVKGSPLCYACYILKHF